MTRSSSYWLWAVLSVPALIIAYRLATSNDPRIFQVLAHPAAETAARLLIVTMMVSPLMLLLKGWRGPQFLKKNRRAFGVAAFAYAALHTCFYLIDKGSLAKVVADMPRTYIWTGWLAFALFIPLAVTSTDRFVRLLGTRWKTLQRLTYPAALLVLIHWASIKTWEEPAAAIVHFAPLAALECYRIWFWYLRPRPRRAMTV